MSKQINELRSFFLGEPKIELANDGKAVDEVVIQYKDIFVSVFLDAESGEPTGDFGWSHDATVFSVPVRRIVKTVLPKEGK